jgi:hypothetical protein
MDADPSLVQDWQSLQGQCVRISKDGQLIRTGRVEAVTADGAVLWIENDGNHMRTLYAKAEGYNAWLPRSCRSPRSTQAQRQPS